MAAGEYDKRFRIKETMTVVGTGQTFEYWKLVGSVRTSTAIKRRRRPSPLDTTGASWYKTTTDPTLYEDGGKMFKYHGTASFVWPSGPMTEEFFSSGGSKRTAIDRATRRFASNTGAGISTIEMPSTVRMIGRRAKTFYDFVRLSGKGNFHGARKLMKSATGYNISSKTVKHLESKYGSGSFSFARASAAWLEYNFGWKTFFQTIYDSVDSLGSSVQQYGKSAKWKGASAGFIAEVTNSRQFAVNRLGLGNPLEMAWDKLRLSFVVDWFVPITPFLQSLSAGRGLGTIYGYASSSETHKLFSNGKLVTTHETYNREAIRYSGFNLQIAPTGGLWKTITSLALFQGMR